MLNETIFNLFFYYKIGLFESSLKILKISFESMKETQNVLAASIQRIFELADVLLFVA